MDLASQFSDIGRETARKTVDRFLVNGDTVNRYFLILFFSLFGGVAIAQSGAESLSPQGAFLRSLAVPGWGHHYVDSNSWSRGQYHLGAEAALLISYFGLNIHSNNLQQNWQAYAVKEAGVSVKDRSRSFQLAVGEFNSLSDYNDFQTRARNWDQLIADTPENRWRWANDSRRNEYNSIRSRFESIDQQLPALVGFMVVNRLISAVSAYNWAKKAQAENSFTSLSVGPGHGTQGVAAHLKVFF